ncbi:MAG: GMC family oxidoreductase [Acidobacteriota bacterium]
MAETVPCDVVVIGSGAGGGPLALTLARAGFDVLVLEKGPRHPRDAYLPDEIEVLRRGFFTPSLADDPHTVVTRASPRAQRTALGWIASCVGGGTVHMGSYLYRFHPDDLRMRSRFGAPAARALDGAALRVELADWPFDYDTLEPWYGVAEREVGVAGEAGANPFEAPRSTPYPLPPLDAHPVAAELERAMRRRGLHPFPTPRGIASRPYEGRPACSYCASCAGYGCPTGARGSVQEALLPRAEATGRCHVLADTAVHEITVDDAGRATGCLAVGPAGALRVRARVVCVCCSAVESARLLLLSRSPRFPDGLANGSGRVGRHLQFHGVTMGLGLVPRARLPEAVREMWHPFLGRSAMDHYFLPEGVAEPAKGGLLRFFLVPPSPVMTAEQVAFADRAAGGSLVWGRELLERLERRYRDDLAIGFEVFHDFLPNDGTYVGLDPEVCDAAGRPVARIHLEVPEHQRRVGEWTFERAAEILRDLGAESFEASAVGGTSSYLVHGTCRAGDDPATSVLDSWCRAHEVPNLYVVDGSFMPTSGGAPPTLTILANSFRVADRLVDVLRRT